MNQGSGCISLSGYATAWWTVFGKWENRENRWMSHFEVTASPHGLIVLWENIFQIYLWGVSIHFIGFIFGNYPEREKKCLALHLGDNVSSIIIMMRCCVLELAACIYLLYEAIFIQDTRLIIGDRANKSKVMPSLKSCSTRGALELDQRLCSSHRDRHCLQRHVFPGKLSPASRHLPQQRRERHLFRFPAEIQCGIFSFQRGALWPFSRDYKAATTTDRRWRPHETRHCSDCTQKDTARGRPEMCTLAAVGKYIPHANVYVYYKASQTHTNHTSSSEPFIINRGNHRRPLIGDALVGVSEVSGVLSLSICKLPRLGEKRRDVALSCAPPGDCEGCNLKPSFSSHHQPLISSPDSQAGAY